jgi:hypothetical protein
VTVSGPLVSTGGQLGGPGTVTADRGLSISGDEQLLITGCTPVNTGAATWSGGVNNADNGAVLSNTGTGTFEVPPVPSRSAKTCVLEAMEGAAGLRQWPPSGTPGAAAARRVPPAAARGPGRRVDGRWPSRRDARFFLPGQPSPRSSRLRRPAAGGACGGRT